LINLGIGFLVAVEGETVVGYIVFWLKEEKRGHIISLAVDKKYRGRKIATQLLTKVVIIFKGVEANKITLEVRGDNSGAIEFYKKFGFLIDRKVPNYYEDGQEAYVMYFDKLVTN
jgi:ribosomal-protein-alanine N-acetyltransferase